MRARSFSYRGGELDALRGATNYYRWILSYFAPYVGKRVVEVGAGMGTFSAFLLNGTHPSELVLIEPDNELFLLLQERFSGDTRVKLVHGHAGNQAACFPVDSAVLVNVLEHIADDENILQTLYQMLAPSGALLLFVPAIPGLYGSLDKVFGHHRRYTKSSLARKLSVARFRIVCLRYFNFPGVMTWFVAGKVLRRRTLHPLDVRLYDRLVVPWISRLERHWEPPIGQSLIAIARK